jgi:putative ABC transport system permease protein
MLMRSLEARRARVALGLTVVALGTGMAVALATLALKVGDDVALALRAAGPNFVIQPRGASWTPDLGGAEVTAARASSGFDEAAVADLKKSFWKNNILQAAPELTVPAVLGGQAVALVGTWFDHPVATEEGAWSTGLHRLHPTWTLQGRWPRDGASEVALGRRLAEQLRAQPGSPVELTIGAQPLRLLVSGVVSADGADDQRVWTSLAQAQALSGRPSRVDRVWMSALVRPGPRTPPPDAAKDPKGYERYMCTAYPTVVAAELEGHMAGVEVIPATERITGEAHIVTRLTLLMLLLTAAALTASILGLLSTTTATVVERATELALLRAIGASPRQLLSLLIGETGIVCLAGGLLGWVLGSLGGDAMRGSALGAATFQPVLLPVALVIAALVGVLGTLAPLRMALRLDPARVLHG